MAESDTSAFFLGSVPVTDATNKVMESALELLMVKLDTIQAKMIDKIVEKKHGTRLSKMSPVYQKLAAKLKKKGMDCTVGDEINIRLRDASIEMREPASSGDVASINVIPFAEIKLHTIFNGRDSRSILAFVRTESHSLMTASYINGSYEAIKQISGDLDKMMSAFRASASGSKMLSSTSVLGQGATFSTPLGDEDADDQIMFGVGLHKKSSFRVKKQVRRRRTVNLKGSKTGEVKRRSDTYGNSFASLGTDAPAASTSASGATTFQAAGKGGAAFDDDFDDDDLLTGVSEDLFGGSDDLGDFLEDDTSNDAVAAANEYLRDADEIEFSDSDGDIDMEGFGFNTDVQ